MRMGVMRVCMREGGSDESVYEYGSDESVYE